MSLINDALRRASQSDKNRPNRTPTPIGMEAAPVAQSSRLTGILIGVVLVALLLAGWLFWQWWTVRHARTESIKEPNLFPAVTLSVPAQPVAVPKPAAIAPPPPAKPAPAPATVAAPPVVVAPVAPPVAVVQTPKPAVAAPSAPPATTADDPVLWPSDLKVSAIFYSRTNPRALINGNIYGVGDRIQGILVKRIGTDNVTLESHGHTKVMFLEGQ